MPEEVLFEHERARSREGIAAYLRTVADRLETGDPVSLEAGGDEIALEVPESVEFEVKVEREGPADSPGEIGFELELEWDENAGGGGRDDGLAIE